MEHRVDHIDILELIPQRAPVVMVTKLVSVEEQSATSILHINEDNVFVANGRFRECGLVENIAQTAAAMNGYRALAGGEAVKKGYIGAVKNLRIFTLPGVNSTLTTLVREETMVMNTSIIKGQIRLGDQLIAECEMKVFLQDQ